MRDKTPQVFISYSWTSDEFKEKVKHLAKDLLHDGIEVKLDIWELKDGQDKYAFMEQCVTNPEIDKVLIICDSGYATKADSRSGGVGDETAIISAEVYGHANQEKFVPVIMERNGHGEPYMPAYLKSRMYKDLTGDNYNKGYQSLVRNIYEQPLERKPELGSRPVWLDENTPDALYKVKKAEENVNSGSIEKLKRVAVRDFIDTYLEAMKPFYKKTLNNDEYLKDFQSLLDYRNIFLDNIKKMSMNTEHFGEFMADIFERMYNTLYNVYTYEPETNSCTRDSFDIFSVHIWELFICTVAFMLHDEMYEDINELLVHTYFLRISPLENRIEAMSYEQFRVHSKVVEEKIKPTLSDDLKNKFTLLGHIVINEREYLPIYSGRSIANADLFLYQVYNGLNIDSITQYYQWFPTCYVYADGNNSLWQKLKSKKFCKKIMPLFGAKSIDELKKCLVKCVSDRNVRYSGAYFNAATAIMDYINEDEIAVLP